jgi:hypothetical protein
MAGDSDQWARLVLDALNKIAYSPSNTWNQAINYEGLPEPNTVPGSTWLVLVGTGFWPVNKPSGWYFSNGTSWLYLGAYNPIVTGGNVAVTNFPGPALAGEGSTVVVPTGGTALLETDSSRKGFILTAAVGIVYVGMGFMPSGSRYTYRMTNNTVIEKDGFAGPVYAVAEDDQKEIYVTEIK